MASTTESITESITAIMEKKSKRVVLTAIILGLTIGLAACGIASHQEQNGGGDQSQLSADVSLNAGENTPQEVFDKIDESRLAAESNAEQGSEKTEVSSETGTIEDKMTEMTEGQASEEDGISESQEGDEPQLQESEESQTQESGQAGESGVQEQNPEEGSEKKEQETAVNVGTGASPEDRVIDFAGLQSKKNAHIYAWISVPGTNVDYPVLRHPTDDGYYLYHNLNGSSGYPGCIYTENWNSKDWTDPVTVLYGHDMRSTGTMFHQLHKFEKQNFFDKYQYIYIYTPEKTLKYWIFATYVHSNEHLLYNHNFSDKDVFDSFFDTVLNSAGGVNHVRDGVTITSDSKIITLSTCIKNKPNNRYLIFGVLQ